MITWLSAEELDRIKKKKKQPRNQIKMYRKSLSSKCRPLLEYSIEIIVIKITLKEQIYFLKKNYMYITKKNLKKG